MLERGYRIEIKNGSANGYAFWFGAMFPLRFGFYVARRTMPERNGGKFPIAGNFRLRFDYVPRALAQVGRCRSIRAIDLQFDSHPSLTLPFQRGGNIIGRHMTQGRLASFRLRCAMTRRADAASQTWAELCSAFSAWRCREEIEACSHWPGIWGASLVVGTIMFPGHWRFATPAIRQRLNERCSTAALR